MGALGDWESDCARVDSCVRKHFPTPPAPVHGQCSGQWHVLLGGLATNDGNEDLAWERHDSGVRGMERRVLLDAKAVERLFPGAVQGNWGLAV